MTMSGMGIGQSSRAPSLCDILDSPRPKNTAAITSSEDIHGQVIIGRRAGRGRGTEISMSTNVEEDSATGASMSVVDDDNNDKKEEDVKVSKGQRSARKRRREESEGECLELRLRIEELESLVKNGREAWEEARGEACRLREENEELGAAYERLKFTYFDSLCEAVKLDVSPKAVSFKRRRATKTQWAGLGAGVEQSARDLFAEATAERIEPVDYPSWISNRLSASKKKKGTK